jgi:hypothetical protein
MEDSQAFDDLVGLEKSLWHQVKSPTADLYPSHNPVYNRSIKKKIRFVKWILKALKSEDFTHQDLLDMIDIKIDKSKKELEHARIRTHIDRVYDSIQSLEWLRYLMTSTNRGAFGNLNII